MADITNEATPARIGNSIREADEALTKRSIRAAAFDEWWATMKAQGYDYGYEALCNTRTGFDGGRSTLAQKVLEIVEGEHLDEYVPDEADFAARDRGRHEEDIAYDNAVNHVLTALRELFQREGVEVDSTST